MVTKKFPILNENFTTENKTLKLYLVEMFETMGRISYQQTLISEQNFITENEHLICVHLVFF